MNAKFLKATTFVVAGMFAGVAVAQDEAAPEVPAGPTPQEVAAQNMSELLDLVKQVARVPMVRTVRASSGLLRTKRISNQNSIALSASVLLRSAALHVSKRSLKITNSLLRQSKSSSKSVLVRYLSFSVT